MNDLHVKFITMLCFLLAFHLAEYLIHKYLHPTKTTAADILLTKKYITIYFVLFLISHIQWKYYDSLLTKYAFFTDLTGYSLIIIGIIVRIIAIMQLKRNYLHSINCRKYSYNSLVTNGIYSLIRHPCYSGFMLIHIGIMVYLQNIIGVLFFIVFLNIFFHKRILFEERMLCKVFPNEYEKYKSRVWLSVL